MAGLNHCSGFTPFGYQLQPVASTQLPAPVPPREYNRSTLPPAPWARIHTPAPIYGPVVPPLNGPDIYGNQNAQDEPFPRIPPEAYNVGAIQTTYDKHTPVPVPWTKKEARAQLAASISGGSIEPRKDIKDLAQTFAETAVDPAEKFWWTKRVNILTQIDAIEATRGLNVEEGKLKSAVLKEIADKSQMLPPVASLATPYAAPAAFPKCGRHRRRNAFNIIIIVVVVVFKFVSWHVI